MKGIILFGSVGILFAVLDFCKIYHLMKKDSGKIVIWKSCTAVLWLVAAGKVFDILRSVYRGYPVISYPLVDLIVIAMLLFPVFVFFEKWEKYQ